MGSSRRTTGRVTPAADLELGLRYDYEALPAPPIPIAAIPQTSNHPSDKNNIGPRLGFSYDLFGNGKSVFFAAAMGFSMDVSLTASC